MFHILQQQRIVNKVKNENFGICNLLYFLLLYIKIHMYISLGEQHFKLLRYIFQMNVGALG